MDSIRGIVFDLDDTLYLERDYVLSGFSHIARTVGGCKDQELDIQQFLFQSFEEGVRGNSFDRLLQRFPEVADRWTVDQLVGEYRRHEPQIVLAPAMRVLLSFLSQVEIPLALISDGPVECQSAKIAALGIGPLFEPCILTDVWGIEFRKPNPRAFMQVMRLWNMPPERLVYIADNPLKDFKAPRTLGWKTVQLQLQGAVRGDIGAPAEDHSASVVVRSTEELSNWLFERMASRKGHAGAHCE